MFESSTARADASIATTPALDNTRGGESRNVGKEESRKEKKKWGLSNPTRSHLLKMWQRNIDEKRCKLRKAF